MCVNVYLSIIYMPGSQEDHMKALYPLGLKLMVVVS